MATAKTSLGVRNRCLFLGLLYPLRGDARVVVPVRASLNLFGAIVLFQPVGDEVHYRGREGLVLVLPFVPCNCLPLSRFGPVAPAVPLYLPFDRGPVPSYHSSDLNLNPVSNFDKRSFTISGWASAILIVANESF